MKICARVGSSVLTCVLLSGTTSTALAEPPAAASDAATTAAAASPEEADRISTASVIALIDHHRRGHDLSFVARTTLARDLSAWRVSAGRNRPSGQLMLGLCNYYGIGGAHNPKRGRELILAAANAKHGEAMAVFSIILRNGNLETRPAVDEANGWLGKALAAKSRIAADEVALAGARELLIEGKVNEAMDAYGSSARAGNLSARVALAGIRRRSWLVPSNIEQSILLLEEAAKAGHVVAMIELGDIHARGRYLPPDPMKAKRWLEAAAATDDPRGLLTAAEAYERGDLDEKRRPDIQRASTLLTKLKSNSDPYSAYALYCREMNRSAHTNGEHDAAAKKWLLDAATRGVAETYAYLGHAYIDGDLDMKKDPAMARRLFEDGVAAGDPLALFQRACGYRFGYWSRPDEDKARADYFAAARLGVAKAMTSVALRYMSGRGVPLDQKLGHLCYRAAAFEGDTEAMCAIAAQFETGVGVTRDPESARRWSIIAIAEGNPAAYETLADLEGASQAAAPNAMMPPKALAMLEEGVQAGSLQCERTLAERLVNGRGVPQDVKRGVSMLERAAIRDEFGVCHWLLGDLCLNGTIIPRDLPGALLHFRTAAARGNGDAWERLAHMSDAGLGTARDNAESIRCLEKGIALGSSMAMYSMGVRTARGESIPKDATRAVALLQQSADLGYSPAFRALAEHYLMNPDRAALDEKKGMSFVERGLAAGDAASALAAAIYYRDREDWAAERVWLERGDAMGDGGCSNNLGVQYRFGRGGPEDFTKAAEAYQRAADRGNLDGAANLAWCYETGNGVAKDPGEAFRTLLKAAMAGHTPSMLHTARMYIDGTGIGRDQQMGLHWLVKAADAGDPRAKTMVEAARAKGLIR